MSRFAKIARGASRLATLLAALIPQPAESQLAVEPWVASSSGFSVHSLRPTPDGLVYHLENFLTCESLPCFGSPPPEPPNRYSSTTMGLSVLREREGRYDLGGTVAWEYGSGSAQEDISILQLLAVVRGWAGPWLHADASFGLSRLTWTGVGMQSARSAIRGTFAPALGLRLPIGAGLFVDVTGTAAYHWSWAHPDYVGLGVRAALVHVF